MTKFTFTEKKDTRSGFGAGFLELGRTNENVVGLCADLIGSLKMDAFQKEFPNRFFQVGIAEANMMGIAAGMTIGGKETHGSWENLPSEAWPSTAAGSDARAKELVIGFERGAPVSIDGKAMAAVELVEALNALGGQFAIGRGMHLGDTVLGIKGRVAYSAPAAHILIESHRELEKLTLSASQQFWKETLGNLYGRMVHEGQALDPLCRDLEAMLESSQRMVSGEVRVRLQDGYMQVLGSRSPHSLMALQPAAYGEQSTGWSGDEVAAYNKLHAMQQKLCWAQQQQAEAAQ